MVVITPGGPVAIPKEAIMAGTQEVPITQAQAALEVEALVALTIMQASLMFPNPLSKSKSLSLICLMEQPKS